ncbi:hypothetical protein [Egbenema bharatensis]|uniref:hypothetical protein n=1 Tax=Egbenema bharatensis TaxID=3463334 RepID=UPI003A874FD3
MIFVTSTRRSGLRKPTHIFTKVRLSFDTPDYGCRLRVTEQGLSGMMKAIGYGTTFTRSWWIYCDRRS